MGIFLFSGVSPVATSFDSRWTVYTVMSLWERGDTNLDEYGAAIVENDFYAIECVEPAGAVHAARDFSCGGHLYSRYPIGVPVLTAPLVLAQVALLRAAQPLIANLHSANPVIEAFLRGDYGPAHPLIEMQVASAILALTALVLYWIARRYLPEGKALFLALIFATSTSAYSTGGRALWSHTPSMLLLATIIYLLLAAEERGVLAAWAGVPVALAYTVRPTDALFVLVFTAYVAMRHRAQLWRYLAAAAPVAILFLGDTLSTYRGHLSPYYNSTLPGFLPANWGRMAEALAGNLASPGRGLLVYTPIFILAVWSLLRGTWKTPLSPWLAALAVAHWVAMSAYVDNWWGGHSYGPRFFTDLTPVFTLFLIPYLERWEQMARAARTAFVALVLVGFGLHLRGGWSGEVYRWNTDPTNIDDQPERSWDWRDAQFMRGMTSAPPRRPR